MTHPRTDRRSKRRAEAAERQAARDARSDLEQITIVMARGARRHSPEVERLELRDWPAGWSFRDREGAA